MHKHCIMCVAVHYQFRTQAGVNKTELNPTLPLSADATMPKRMFYIPLLTCFCLPFPLPAPAAMTGYGNGWRVLPNSFGSAPKMATNSVFIRGLFMTVDTAFAAIKLTPCQPNLERDWAKQNHSKCAYDCVQSVTDYVSIMKR